MPFLWRVYVCFMGVRTKLQLNKDSNNIHITMGYISYVARTDDYVCQTIYLLVVLIQFRKQFYSCVTAVSRNSKILGWKLKKKVTMYYILKYQPIQS